MTPIADSNAFRDGDRLLPQHQAALTLLQARLSAPGLARLSWLDLACGRGQIIAALDKNLSPQARSKVDFWAYDLNHDYARETGKTAAQLGLASFQATVGELSAFDRMLPRDALFDFITLTNTIHEIDPVRLSTLLVACLQRLSDAGTLFVYDMERIQPPELGAVPWNRDDMRRIVLRMLDALGASTYRPEVGLWNHRSCNGWNVHLERCHVGVSRDDVARRIETAIQATRDEVSTLLRQRLANCRASLETLTLYGAETPEEEAEKERLLFEFWSLSRALESRP